jgi:hypothetical protein
MGDWVEDIIPQRFSELEYFFGMAGRAKPSAFTAKGKQIFISTLHTTYSGETILQIPTCQILSNHLSYNRTKETVLFLKPFFIALLKALIMVVTQPPQCRRLRFPRVIYFPFVRIIFHHL